MSFPNPQEYLAVGSTSLQRGEGCPEAAYLGAAYPVVTFRESIQEVVQGVVQAAALKDEACG